MKIRNPVAIQVASAKGATRSVLRDPVQDAKGATRSVLRDPVQDAKGARRSVLRELSKAVVFAALLCATAAAVSASSTLAVRLDGDYLRVSLPSIDFLKGKPLDRLKDGASVAFIGQVTITTSPNSLTPVARSVAHFALSYDIWEERFSITKIGQTPESRRTVSHLSAQLAEAWCLDNLGIDRSLIPADKEFYVELDLRAEDPKDNLGIIGDPGINLTRLIEMFGRPPRSPQERWLFSSGPLRLADLKKTEIHGGRG